VTNSFAAAADTVLANHN